MEQASPMFAAIDLGSNSFHMLVVRELSGSVQTIAKIKRKVRLASGLNQQNQLSKEAMQRGWDCLRLFAEQLRDIPASNVRIVGTATLRIATNIDTFIQTAEEILKLPVEVISGHLEAQLIYRGVAATSSGTGQRLVIDIGGASTELVIGEGRETRLLNSLDLGCVTWLNNHFPEGHISASIIQNAIRAAKQTIEPYLSDYRRLGWTHCVGASGTVQAVQEVLIAQGYSEQLTLDKLLMIKQQAQQFNNFNELKIVGLAEDRKPVFVSGLSILIALFEGLKITQLSLSGGALREGIVYGLLSQSDYSNVRQRTIKSFMERHHIDAAQAEFVSECATELVAQLDQGLTTNAINLLLCACSFHEVGLNIEYKQAPRHAAYIIDHADLPGFSMAQKQLLSVLVLFQRGPWKPLELEQGAIEYQHALSLSRLLRIAVIICMRRNHASGLPDFKLQAKGTDWVLQLPQNWDQNHPLRAAELHLEAKQQTEQGFPLLIID